MALTIDYHSNNSYLHFRPTLDGIEYLNLSSTVFVDQTNPRLTLVQSSPINLTPVDDPLK